MSAFTTFGPGTFTIKIGAGAAVDYSGECTSFTVNHSYSEVGSNRVMLNGDKRRAKKRRENDSVTIGLEPSLTDAGLYAVLQANDLVEALLEYTPNTENPSDAKWAGNVELSLPESVEGAEYGAPITSSLTLNCVTTLTFTPEDTTP